MTRRASAPSAERLGSARGGTASGGVGRAERAALVAALEQAAGVSAVVAGRGRACAPSPRRARHRVAVRPGARRLRPDPLAGVLLAVLARRVNGAGARRRARRAAGALRTRIEQVADED